MLEPVVRLEYSWFRQIIQIPKQRETFRTWWQRSAVGGASAQGEPEYAGKDDTADEPRVRHAFPFSQHEMCLQKY